MRQESNSRTDVIMAGFGAMGALMAGQILSLPALIKNPPPEGWFSTTK